MYYSKMSGTWSQKNLGKNPINEGYQRIVLIDVFLLVHPKTMVSLFRYYKGSMTPMFHTGFISDNVILLWDINKSVNKNSERLMIALFTTSFITKLVTE